MVTTPIQRGGKVGGCWVTGGRRTPGSGSGGDEHKGVRQWVLDNRGRRWGGGGEGQALGSGRRG
jgi:hypothetical protein